MRQLSDQQEEIYIFLWDFFRANDQLPTQENIGARFGFTVRTAAWHLRALERHHLIERNAVGKYRFVRSGLIQWESAVAIRGCHLTGVAEVVRFDVANLPDAEVPA